LRRAAALVCALVLACAACSSGDGEATTTGPPATSGGAGFRQVIGGLDSPVGIASTPSEPNRLYVVEQTGTLRVLDDGGLEDEPFLDITDQVVSGGEQGLLSLVFDPDYASNGFFYVDYTDLQGDTRVVQYEAAPGESPVRRRQLLFVDQPYSNHNGGQLAFGPDGRLYVGMGDGGAGGDPQDRAQNLDERLGKLLSLDVHGGGWRIEGYGLRNPWRFSFDRETGDLWIGDVGQNAWEEIDHTPRSSPGLENYGWDAFEGTHPYEEQDQNPAGHLVDPVYEYSHDHGCSVTGGYVYRGSRSPVDRGRYFFGDYCSGTIWSLASQGGNAGNVSEAGHVAGLSAFGEDAGGELYAASLEGKIYRLEAG